MLLAIVLAVAGVLALLVFALGGVVLQLLRQHGAILLRLDELEHRLRRSGAAGEPAGPGESRPAGLPVGTPLRPFSLPGVTGEQLGLDDFPGRRLLVHWSPDCGFCEHIAGDLAELRDDVRRRGAEIILVSWGAAEANRRFAEQHGLGYPILLQDGSEPVEEFRSLGTPVGYLVDARGRLASPLAHGGEEVLQLARDLAAGRRRLPGQRPLTESRIERRGLRAGTPAPAFELPDLNGNPVSLAAFRGQRVLLVFSDPNCGPCTALAPELARFNRDHDGHDLAVLMVSRGDAEANRSKAQQLGLNFPIVIQPGWRISKKYGIFATPVAFLVDEQGTLARDVAQGHEQILALAEQALNTPKEVKRHETAPA
jgi:peroxiredoxin